ncbi:NAD(P)-binding protein [Venturia nashicola]|nr:NAD(P)-binding protein [Venturia nashicola]
MSFTYTENKVVDCSISPDLSILKSKTVVVTGGKFNMALLKRGRTYPELAGSSGLGAAYVRAFSNAGAQVTIADLNDNPELTALQGVQFIKCDVRVWSEQLEAFKSALDQSSNKKIDIVIANAGIAAIDSVLTIDESEEPQEPDLRMAEVNILGVLYTTKLALHYFAKSPSPPEEKCLILKSSVAGYLDLPNSAIYQTSKYAVRGLMCNLRREGRCRVNVVAPWFINTPIMSATVIKKLVLAFKAMKSDFAEVEDSVKAVLRLACDQTINGRALGIIPRDRIEAGYVDLEVDDYAKGDLLHELLSIAVSVNHRSLFAEDQ